MASIYYWVGAVTFWIFAASLIYVCFCWVLDNFMTCVYFFKNLWTYVKCVVLKTKAIDEKFEKQLRIHYKWSRDKSARYLARQILIRTGHKDPAE